MMAEDPEALDDIEATEESESTEGNEEFGELDGVDAPEWESEDEGEFVTVAVLAGRLGITRNAAAAIARRGELLGVAQDVYTGQWLIPRGSLPPPPAGPAPPPVAIRTDRAGWLPGSHAALHHSGRRDPRPRDLAPSAEEEWFGGS